MQFEYDPERLIDEIKKRTAIWDYNDVGYRSMVTRYQLWDDVVRELLDPGVTITKGERRELVLQLQKKWKGMKDAYLKYLNNPSRTKRPYLYSKHLQFLTKNMQVNTPEGASAEGASDSEEPPKKKKKNGWKRKRISIVKDEDDDDGNSSGNDNTSANFIEVSNAYSNDESDNQPLKTLRNKSSNDEFAFANVDSKNLDNEDTDKMFLMSLWPHLKSIPEEARLSVKMELMQVLQNANYKHVQIITDTIL